jgi:outer membrane protein TolC
VGEGTNLEDLTAKVQRTQAQNGLDVARSDLTLAMSTLQFALGRTGEQMSDSLILTDSLMYRPHALALDPLLGQASESSPLIQSSAFRVNAASVNRSIAWSSILPSLTLSYAWQVQGANPNLYGAAFGISLPIWFLLDQRGQVQEAIATHAVAESELQSSRNAVNLTVRNAFVEFKNDERQVLLYQTELLPQADEVYRTAAASYEAGALTYIEFLLARQTLISARSGHIDALYHYNTSIARLEKAIGRHISE